MSDYSPEHLEVRRAMTPEEQKQFLHVAASREEWSFVYQYALLALSTSASGCEMRGLRIEDLNLNRKVLLIRRDHAKNHYRIRTIPMNEAALWAAGRLLKRARLLGARVGRHFLMPFRVAPHRRDPRRPMSNSGIRKAWEAVRATAGVPW